MNLFVGFDPGGREFGFINQGFIGRTYAFERKRLSVIQLRPDAAGINDFAETGGHSYEEYFERSGIKVYWGTAEELAVELLERWKKFSKQ